MKIKNLPPNTIFIHDGHFHLKLDDDFPFNAVNLATSKAVRLAGERVAEDEIITTWNELHAEVAKAHGVQESK